MTTASELSQAIERTPDGTELVVIDLSEVSFLDSSGLNALVQGRRTLAERGIAMTVVVPPESAIRPRLRDHAPHRAAHRDRRSPAVVLEARSPALEDTRPIAAEPRLDAGKNVLPAPGRLVEHGLVAADRHRHDDVVATPIGTRIRVGGKRLVGPRERLGVPRAQPEDCSRE